jgi:hypothetical protein
MRDLQGPVSETSLERYNYFAPVLLCGREAALSHGRHAHWGTDWPELHFALSFIHELQRRLMDSSSQIDLTRLRSTITLVRLEKSRLAAEITSSVTSSERRQYAVRRYSALVQELRMNADELEKIIGAAKRAEANRIHR